METLVTIRLGKLLELQQRIRAMAKVAHRLETVIPNRALFDALYDLEVTLTSNWFDNDGRR